MSAAPAIDRPAEGVVLQELSGWRQAQTWLGASRNALVASIISAVGISDRHAMDMALALHPTLLRGGQWNDCLKIAGIALTVACHTGDVVAEALAHAHLGTTHTVLGDYQLAEQHLRKALAFYLKSGHHGGLGMTYVQLMRMAKHQQLPFEALRYAECALKSFRTAGLSQPEAFALNDVGWFHISTGNIATALPFLDQSLGLHRSDDSDLGQVYALDSIGYARYLLGDQPMAISSYQRALALARDLTELTLTADVLTHAGDAYFASGNDGDAGSCWREALAIRTDLGDSNTGNLRTRLGRA
jgi:tetratricopeptide (TPR) repeat protein